MELQQIILLINLFLLIIFFSVSLFNLLTAPKFKVKNDVQFPDKFVSILIPARNEENNISECLDSIINQTYKSYEVIVLDDESTDQTCNIVKRNYGEEKNINLIKGKPLPDNWLGKNWACHQLSQNAKGELLLFLDADVRLHKDSLKIALNFFEETQSNFLSCFPTQKIRNFGEWLVVPLMNFFLLSLLPLRKVFNSNKESFAAANGQFLLIERKAYDLIGGHKAIANKIVEDMELVRTIKKKKLRAITLLGNNFVSCRMYRSFKEAFNGFSKNFYPGFKTKPFIFLTVLSIVIFSFLLPFIGIFFYKNFLYPISLIILIRSITSYLSNQNIIYNLVLHPLQIILMFLIGINSVWKNKFRQVEWKGRKIRSNFI